MVTDHAWPYNKLKADATPEENSAVGFLNYSSMTIKEMIALGPMVNKIMNDNSLIFAWGTWPFLKECIEVHESWGYDYVTCAFAWVKTNKLPVLKRIMEMYVKWKDGSINSKDIDQIFNDKAFFGMGRWTASNTEYCLLFRKGRPKFRKILFSQLVTTAKGAFETEAVYVADSSLIPAATLVHPVTGHSVKPDEVQDRIEKMVDGPYIELFARRSRPNWLCLGNEVTGNDIRSDLNDLGLLINKEVYTK